MVRIIRAPACSELDAQAMLKNTLTKVWKAHRFSRISTLLLGHRIRQLVERLAQMEVSVAYKRPMPYVVFTSSGTRVGLSASRASIYSLSLRTIVPLPLYSAALPYLATLYHSPSMYAVQS